MFTDRKFRLARVWSNRELRKLAPLFSGDVVNVSAWDDRDKEGGFYREYFDNAASYSYTNYDGYRGLVGMENEHRLDLTGDVPDNLGRGFDVVFNHTTLEHIFEVRRAFANLCELSRDVVIVVVPFSQIQHESASYGDYWRFTPTCLRQLFKENGLSVIYEAESPYKRAAVYLLFAAAREPERWRELMPAYRSIEEAGSWIGNDLYVRIVERIRSFLAMVKRGLHGEEENNPNPNFVNTDRREH